MDFFLTLTNVLIFIAMAVPGYILIKTKFVKTQAIAVLSIVLLYVNQPFLTLKSFLEIEYSVYLLKNLGIAFLIALISQLLMFIVVYLILKGKYNQRVGDGFLSNGGTHFKDDAKRVLTVACAFGNVGFLGVPVIKALLPLSAEAIAYAAVYLIAMNLLCWTLGAYVLTGDKSYVSLKKAFLNPPTATLIVALPLFFFGVKLPEVVLRGVTYLADMTTPMCMLILGMRFATLPLYSLFKNAGVWLGALTKTVVFPILVFLALYFLPVDNIVKATMLILSAMPTATVTLNMSEIFDADSKTAANVVMLSTLLSAITVPSIMLLLKI